MKKLFALVLALVLALASTSAHAQQSAPIAPIGPNYAGNPPFVVSPAYGNGSVDVSGALNTILASQPAVILPCGTYLIASTLKINSSQDIQGQGDCTVIKLASTFSPAASNYKAVLAPSFGGATIENIDYVNGNSQFAIRNLTIDGSDLLPQAMHVMAFYKVNSVVVENVRIRGRDNADTKTYTGVALINSYNNRVTGLRTKALVTGIGTWDNSHDEVFANNFIVGGSSAMAQNGIVVNGIATNFTASTSYAIQVVNNTIWGFPAANATAIDATGLCYSADNQPCSTGVGPYTYGLLNDSVVSGNTIINHGGVGIRLGEGSNLTAANNVIDGTGNYAISVRSGRAGPTNGVIVSNNQIANANMNNAANIDAIHIGNGTDAPTGVVVTGNIITGSPVQWRYSYRVDAGVVGARIVDGSAVAGASGVYSDAGTGTLADLTGSWTPSLTLGGAAVGMTYATRTGQYWVTGKNARYCGQITLTAKGSSTGAAAITGLPLTSAAFEQPIQIGKQQNILGVTWPAPFAVVSASTAFIKLTTDATQSASITDVNFANNSAIQFCGTVAIP